MKDLYIFILIFLAFIVTCRSNVEPFEINEGEQKNEQELEEQEEEEDDDDEGDDEKEEENSVGKGIVNNMFNGYDKNKLFVSPLATNFGSLLELKDVQKLDKFYSDRNKDLNVSKEPIDSQMPSLTGGSMVFNTLKNENNDENKGTIELHMVYADWCKHSQDALKEFEGLIYNNDIKTSSGKKVKFVLTEESSGDFNKFKNEINGFPSFIVNDGNKFKELDVGDRTQTSIINSVKELI